MALKVEIRHLIGELPQIKSIQPVIECITNSLEEDAKMISVKFFSDVPEGGLIVDDRIVNGVEVTDDGKGFTSKNLNAFKEYKTKIKIALGCKGVGRLTWLKIFGQAKIDSVVQEDGKKIKKEFIFDDSFDFGLKPTETEMPLETLAKTRIILSDFRGEKPIYENLVEIRDKIFVELLPMLILRKEKGHEFSILFQSSHPGVEIQSIKSDELPSLESKSFEVTVGGQKEEFVLKCALPDTEDIKLLKARTYAYYCAGGRAVMTFKSKDLSVDLPLDSGEYGIFLLESKLFDQNLNDTRTKIILPDRGFFEHFSWDHINDCLRNDLSEIINKKWPDLQEEANRVKAKLASEHPHLATYIRNFSVVGKVNKSETIDVSVRYFEDAKKKIRSEYQSLLKKNKVKDEDIIKFQELADNTTEIGKQELAEYIWYRKIIIDVMQKLIDAEEKYEKTVHDLIMPRRRKDIDRVEDSNLWLLDDKFSLYQYAASDLEIKQIHSDVCGKDASDREYNDNDDRPDLAIFFSDSRDSEDDIEAVLIELKSFVVDKYDKGKGLDQLPLYAESLQRRNPKIKRIWLFLVVDKIDEEFDRYLRYSRSYTPLFSHNGMMYHNYNDALSAHITVFSMKSLVGNARARNSKFLKIVSGGKCALNAD